MIMIRDFYLIVSLLGYLDEEGVEERFGWRVHRLTIATMIFTLHASHLTLASHLH